MGSGLPCRPERHFSLLFILAPTNSPQIDLDTRQDVADQVRIPSKLSPDRQRNPFERSPHHPSSLASSSTIDGLGGWRPLEPYSVLRNIHAPSQAQVKLSEYTVLSRCECDPVLGPYTALHACSLSSYSYTLSCLVTLVFLFLLFC